MAFPNTPILDNFNRADNTSLGSNWTGLKFGDASNLQIVSNQAIGNLAGFNGQLWNTDFGSPNLEVYWTLVQKPATFDAYTHCRISGSSGSDNNFYTLHFTSTNAWRIMKIVSNVGTNLGTGGTTTFNLGDQIGFSTIGNVITFYQNGVIKEQFTDNAITTGNRIGTENAPDDSFGIDDFGGGSPGSVTVYPAMPVVVSSGDYWG